MFPASSGEAAAPSWESGCIDLGTLSPYRWEASFSLSPPYSGKQSRQQRWYKGSMCMYAPMHINVLRVRLIHELNSNVYKGNGCTIWKTWTDAQYLQFVYRRDFKVKLCETLSRGGRVSQADRSLFFRTWARVGLHTSFDPHPMCDWVHVCVDLGNCPHWFYFSCIFKRMAPIQVQLPKSFWIVVYEHRYIFKTEDYKLIIKWTSHEFQTAEKRQSLSRYVCTILHRDKLSPYTKSSVVFNVHLSFRCRKCLQTLAPHRVLYGHATN